MTLIQLDRTTMRQSVLEVLRRIAPELSPDEIEPATPLRDQIDLDSMDWLRVIVTVHEKLHVDIPEADYGKLRTLDDWAAYLRAKV
jgi:acyl carrier protein